MKKLEKALDQARMPGEMRPESTKPARPQEPVISPTSQWAPAVDQQARGETADQQPVAPELSEDIRVSQTDLSAATQPVFKQLEEAADAFRSEHGVTSLQTRAVHSLSAETIDRERLVVLTGSKGGDAYRIVRTQVLQGLARNNWNTIAVVSAARGDGRSTAALNLGLAIAQDSRYTALAVDFDLRNPSLASKLGLAVDTGVEALFSGFAPTDLRPLIQAVHLPSFAVLPARNSMVGSSEALASAECRRLMQELRERYDDRVLIVDLPPMLLGDDVLTFLPLVDAVILVVGEGVTEKQQLAEIRNVLGDKPVLSLVLNRSAAAAS